MRKFLFTMVALLGMAVSSQAMSFEQAKQQALFLADKMAYELNLNEEQYEACYEVNLDYFMGITSRADLYGDYWTHRNEEMSYILADWQYRMFLDATYFYRPLYWDAGYWHFGIYARYPHRDFFYFGCGPTFIAVYHGGHCWARYSGHSWYHGRDFGHGPGTRNHSSGMRDGFNRGDYGRGSYGSREGGGHGGSFTGQRGMQSSTRSTVGNHGTSGSSYGSGSRAGASGSNGSSSYSGSQHGNGGFTGQRGTSYSKGQGSSFYTQSSTTKRSSVFSGSSRGGGSSHGGGGSFGGGSHGGGSHGGGSFGGGRH